MKNKCYTYNGADGNRTRDLPHAKRTFYHWTTAPLWHMSHFYNIQTCIIYTTSTKSYVRYNQTLHLQAGTPPGHTQDRQVQTTKLYEAHNSHQPPSTRLIKPWRKHTKVDMVHRFFLRFILWWLVFWEEHHDPSFQIYSMTQAVLESLSNIEQYSCRMLLYVVLPPASLPLFHPSRTRKDFGAHLTRPIHITLYFKFIKLINSLSPSKLKKPHAQPICSHFTVVGIFRNCCNAHILYLCKTFWLCQIKLGLGKEPPPLSNLLGDRDNRSAQYRRYLETTGRGQTKTVADMTWGLASAW